MLTREQVVEFHERGYLEPFELYQPSEMVEVRKQIHEQVMETEETPTPNEIPKQYYRHLDCAPIRKMFRDPEVVDRLSSILEPDLLLWSSKIWDKYPGGIEVPWHQHYHHVPLEPPVCITAWIALTPATQDNGCLEVIPESHKNVYPEIESPDHMAFEMMADPASFDNEKRVTIEMEPGECFLFTERLLHRSAENSSDIPRIGLSGRITVPFVNFEPAAVGGGGDSEFTTATLLSGSNEYGINELAKPQ